MVGADIPIAAQGDLPQQLVFVDLETTGGNAAFHRITEVGIVRMESGAVVDEWSSLVNPECRIPSYIESFTGITNAMVSDAPRFADIASVVLDKLRAPVFVAHNARFDYSFLRTEFRRIDAHFAAPVMCTVKLSRRLFPEHPRHNLDAVMARHGLTCGARHRALGDAQVLGQLWSTWLREIPSARLAAAVESVIVAGKLPAYLPQDLADELPEGPGVYRFFGDDGVLLYIGKSQSLRTRILGHFAAEHTDGKEQRKVRQTRRVDWLETAGYLGAELIEAAWIKAQGPLFNQRMKRHAEHCTWRRAANGAGVVLTDITAVQPAALEQCHGLFQSPKDARKALGDIARAHALCPKTLGLEAGDGSCFAYQVGKCRGACTGRETFILHDMRLMMALSALKLRSWPFPGRVALREGHDEYHVLDHWTYLGTVRSEDALADLATQSTRVAFDVDVYRILNRYLAKHPGVDWRALPY